MAKYWKLLKYPPKDGQIIKSQDSDENEQITTIYNDVDESHKQNAE